MSGEPDRESFSNYFNYFTEIEEHFQKARGTSLFLLSPLDWALIETWKNSAIPLEAVLRGIDQAFEKWRTRKVRAQIVNSIAYCAQAVMSEAQRMADAGNAGRSDVPRESAAFGEEQLRHYIGDNVASLRTMEIPEFAAIADSLDQILSELPVLAANPESLELRLSVLEQRLIAVARTRQPEDQAVQARLDLEKYLRPWRSKMSAPQLAMLESQFMDRALLEAAQLPRLSLFYLQK